MPSGRDLKVLGRHRGTQSAMHEPQLGSHPFFLSNSAIPPSAGVDLTHDPTISKSSTITSSLAGQASTAAG